MIHFRDGNARRPVRVRRRQLAADDRRVVVTAREA